MNMCTFFISVCLIKFTSIVRTYVLYFSTSKTTINIYIFFGVLDLVVVLVFYALSYCTGQTILPVHVSPLELVLYLFLCTSG